MTLSNGAAFNPNPLLLIAALILLGAVATFAGYYSVGGAKEGPTRTAASTAPLPVRGVVQSLTSDSITLSNDAGVSTLRLTASTQVETLRPTSLDAVSPGDWVNAGAVPHRQTLLALTGLVVLPDGTYEAPSR